MELGEAKRFNPPMQRKSTTHQERYMHLTHFYSYPKYSAATIFARQESDGLWYVAVAFCWRADQFSRKEGRQNARRNYFRRNQAEVRTAKCIGDKFTYEAAVEEAYRRLRESQDIENRKH